MKTHALILCSLLLALCGGQAATIQKEIQDSIHLPPLTVHCNFSFSLNFESGLDSFELRKDSSLPERIAAAETLAARQTNSVEHFLAVARAWSDADKEDQSTEAYRRAFDLLMAEKVPDGLPGINRKLMLVESAYSVGKSEQAMAWAREITKIDPKNAKAWYVLGSGNMQAANRILLPESHTRRIEEILGAIIKIPRGEESVEKLNGLKKRLDEAEVCFNRCIEISPELGGPYLSRLCVRATAEVLRLHLTEAPGNFELPAFMLKNLTRSDLKHMAQGLANNVNGMALVAYLTVLKCTLETPEGADLSHCARDFVRENQVLIGHMDNLLRPGNKVEAEIAGQTLIFVSIQSQMNLEGAGYAKRLAALFPEEDVYWRAYLNFLEHDKQYDRIIQEGHKRMSAKPDAWTRLKMARAHDLLRQKDEVSAEIELATKLSPNDRSVKLFAALWVLKIDDLTEEKVANYSNIAARLDQDETGDEDWQADIAYLRAICHALKGNYGLAGNQLDRSEEARPGDENNAALRALIKRN